MQAWLEDLSGIVMPNEDIQHFAELYGTEFAVKLMQDFSGILINVPKKGLIKIRDQYICRHYDGSKISRRRLAFEFDLTEGYIKQLVSKTRKKGCNLFDLTFLGSLLLYTFYNLFNLLPELEICLF